MHLVSGGVISDPPDKDDYYGIVSLDRVQLSVFIVMHNGLREVLFYIVNDYLGA